MSTKTTFKRIALVAVAALGLGVLSVAPSSAAPTIGYGIIADSANGQAVVGGQASFVVVLDTATTSTLAVTGAGSILSTSRTSTESITSHTYAAGQTSWTTTANTSVVAPTETITVSSAVAGVTTLTVRPLSASGVPGTAVTKTITWVAATTTGTYDHSTAYISGGNLTARVYSDSTAAQLSFASTLSTTPRATINVTQFNASDTVTATTLSSTGVKAIVATITGAGAVGSTQDGSNAGSSVTVSATSATAEDYIYVYSDGRNGTATVTITVDGKAVATKTVSFFGVVSAYAASTTTGETLSKKNIAIAASASGADAESATVTIVGLDALKTVQASGTIFVTTDTATIATAVVSGSVVYIYGVGLGTTNVNVCNTSACTSATVKFSFPITVVEKTAASYKLAFDAASYDPGAKVTWTVTATTKTGKPIADGSRAVIGTTTNNVSIAAGTVPSGALTFVDGVATGSFFAPATTGTVTLTTVEGAAHDAVIAGGATYTAAKTETSFTVVNASQDAATDAANEATDAANAATDAALAAADAADAATAAAQDASDAVAALSASVSKLISSLRAQITSLTNLVIKIQKKVRA
jgi:trimeric autotransporter adhesin